MHNRKGIILRAARVTQRRERKAQRTIEIGGWWSTQAEYGNQKSGRDCEMAESTFDAVFGRSAVAWFLQLLFFPSGLVTVMVMIAILKRSEYQLREDDKISKAGRLQQRTSSLRRLRDDEIEKVCKEYRIGMREQSALQRDGTIQANSCGVCMGTGTGGYLQLPCGHYAHVRCMRQALQQDIATCADCGFSVKSMFDISPNVPDMEY